ncbi:hypothetical protein Egran_04443 [Elaphomyces granulatus]|uniref:3-ketosteroid reductase n=1 Tax=Elaphomyces granulatus TaxID=519963 RepID=A0A232LUG7_9EURO|nr:hypothetical protein Egran_04443 [Elaphomyces granulatus]
MGSRIKLDKEVFVLVTGANSGLGLSICYRLIDEFLGSRPDPYRLTIIFTTRSTRKGSETLSRLKQHLNAAHRQASGIERVTFESETVDLVDLVSVRALSCRLVKKLPKLDAIVLNAGIGGWTGLNWPQAIWRILTDLVHEVSWPSYKVGPVGAVTGKQTSLAEEPRLGMVFSANVFGHYMLTHNVVPLLQVSGQPNGPGRIIWVSSLETALDYFDPEDIQGLRSETAYETSKTLTDILALTAGLPSTAPWVKSFLCTSDFSSSSSVISTMETKKEGNSPGRNTAKPNIYVTHPGVCGTSILPLSLPLYYCMIFSLWLARMLGSPWHVLSSYMGACAPAWLALSYQRIIDNAEAPYVQHGGRNTKWGSSCDRLGRVRPASSEVDGWGYGGVVGRPVVEEDRIRRRKRGMTDLTAEKKERFEELGRRCWREMEELRKEWDRILDEAETNEPTTDKQ